MSRCVQCGYQLAAHAEDGKCPRQSTTFASMDLPVGKTCSDCYFFRHCTAFIGDVAANTTCDWYPVRFIERAR